MIWNIFKSTAEDGNRSDIDQRPSEVLQDVAWRLDQDGGEKCLILDIREREREIYYIKSLEQYNSILTDDDKSLSSREEEWGKIEDEASFKVVS